MKSLLRVVLVFVVSVGTYYFTYWMLLILFTFILPDGLSGWIAMGAALACGGAAGWYLWTSSESLSQGLVRLVAKGALYTGGIGFVLGFFGPMIIAPDANQGPMLGIFITGPLGFLLGAVGGAVYWFACGREASRMA